MDRKRRLRVAGTSVVGAAIVAGAALLAGPLAGAQAAQYPENFYNEGYCYQSPSGQGNGSRLRAFDGAMISDPSKESVQFLFRIEKWDTQSNQYRDDHGTNTLRATTDISKLLLVDNAQYADANAFCKFVTEGIPELRGEVYSYGTWTSRNSPYSPPQPSGTV